MTTRTRFAAMAALCALAALNGCATWTKITTAVTSPQAQPYITAAAKVAVATAETKGVSQAQILNIAQQALAADQGTGATLATVANVINAELVKLNLPQGDIDAATILEASFEIAIQAQIGSNATVAQSQAAVADILNAIISAAGGLPPAASSAPAAAAPVQPHGGPPPGPTTSTDVPPQNKHFVLSSVESPAAVGGATSLLLVASLQAFAHVTIGAPVAAAITVLMTVGAAAIDNLIS